MNTYERALDALGEPTRRTIVGLLAERPRSVAEVAAQLPVTRPAVSQHLRVLADSGLVTYRRDGTRHVYRLDPSGIGPLRDWISTMWDDVLRAYAETPLEGEER